MHHRLLPSIGVLAALLLVSACSQPPLPEDRVRAYWQALQIADYATAWSMERHARTKEENPLQYYERLRRQWRILDFEFGPPKVGGNIATLDVALDVALPFASGQYSKHRPKQDRWVYADGDWWHLETVPVKPTPPVANAGSATSEPVHEEQASSPGDAAKPLSSNERRQLRDARLPKHVPQVKERKGGRPPKDEQHMRDARERAEMFKAERELRAQETSESVELPPGGPSQDWPNSTRPDASSDAAKDSLQPDAQRP
ncbi:MAG: hypothetical protein JJ992_20995 [Planctomycetes bacterium]|nr:hypothetical protein [Planctomycetota bacterium]